MKVRRYTLIFSSVLVLLGTLGFSLSIKAQDNPTQAVSEETNDKKPETETNTTNGLNNWTQENETPNSATSSEETPVVKPTVPANNSLNSSQNQPVPAPESISPTPRETENPVPSGSSTSETNPSK